MKKLTLFAGLAGALLMVADASAEIKAASTNRVRNSVYDITYGDASETLNTTSTSENDYNYRHGVVPQTRKIESIEGANISGIMEVTSGSTISATTPNISGVTVGNLAAATGTTASEIKSNSTIKKNKANVAVLKRDKLSTATATTPCTSNSECGYVTTGGHNNNPTDKVWLKIATAADAQ